MIKTLTTNVVKGKFFGKTGNRPAGNTPSISTRMSSSETC